MDDLHAAAEALRDRIDSMLEELTAIRDQTDTLAKAASGGVSLGKPVTASPAVTISPGTWLVGRHIQPGTYEATGGSGSFYWARLSNASGDGDVLGNGFADGGRGVVTIKPTDVAFESQCTWTKIG